MQADLIIRGGHVIDGTGSPRFQADVAVRDDRIVAVGDLSDWQAGLSYDAGGKIVAPGFIDPHVHHDEAVLTDPLMPCMTSQGVTTVINGNCGFFYCAAYLCGALTCPNGFDCRAGTAPFL